MMPVMPFTRHELIAQIQVIPATGCWKFLGSIDGNGYGRIFDHGKELKAHRVFYEAWIEPIEEGHFLHHHLPSDRCIGHACCYPLHGMISSANKGSRAYLLPSGIRTQKEDLLSRIRVLPGTGCWEWQESKDVHGYGRLFTKGAPQKAHRVFYAVWFRDIPEGTNLFQNRPSDLCIGRACCNPDHWSVKGELPPVIVESTNTRARQPKPELREVGTSSESKHCPNGHLIDAENSVVETRPNGRVVVRCRICRRESWKKNAAAYKLKRNNPIVTT